MQPFSFHPELFRPWPERPVHGDPPVEEGAARSPEVKAGVLPDGVDLRLLLNDMTLEMRGQFDAFRALREASRPLEAEEDDPGGKLARADLKSAADAMSLIIRTLEKIDVLQRQLARDRRDEAERNAAEPQGYDDAKRHFLDLIERRAEERARILFETWLHERAAAFDGTAAADQQRGMESAEG